MDAGDVSIPYTRSDPKLEALLKKISTDWQLKMRRTLQIFDTTGAWPTGGHAEVGSFMSGVWGQMRKGHSMLTMEQWAVLRRVKFPTSPNLRSHSQGYGQNKSGRVAIRERAKAGTLENAERQSLREEVRQGRCSKATKAALMEGGYLDRFEQLTAKFYEAHQPQAAKA